MAFLLCALSNHPLPLSPTPSSSPLFPSSSLLPVLQTRERHPSRFNPTRCLQSHNGAYPEAEAPSFALVNQKKRRKRKPRPNFFDQTIERWSVKIPSERSKFPWQSPQDEEEEDPVGSPLVSLHSSLRIVEGCPPTGTAVEPISGNREVLAHLANGDKPKSTHLGSEAKTRDYVKDLQFEGEGVKSRLDLIVEKLNFSSDNENSDFWNPGLPSASSSEDTERVNCGSAGSHSSLPADGNPPIAKDTGFQLASRLSLPPWVHGDKSRHTHLGSEAKTETRLETLTCDGKDEICGAIFLDEELDGSSDQIPSYSERGDLMSGRNDEEKFNSICNTAIPSPPKDMTPVSSKTIDISLGNAVFDPFERNAHPEVTTKIQHNVELHAETGKSRVSVIVQTLKNSMDQNRSKLDFGVSCSESDDEYGSNNDRNIVKLMGSISFPWERDSGSQDRQMLHRKSNTELAEKTIPEPELRRLRNAALRMKERMKVGPAGVTEALVESIHKKWKEAEVVKLRFEGPPSLNMKRTHGILESKTGGLVIWRSGRSLVLYRGMTYELPCVQSYSKLDSSGSNQEQFSSLSGSAINVSGDAIGDQYGVSKSSHTMTTFDNQSEERSDVSDIDSLLEQLGPRYKDWSSRGPVPVDADLLPGVVRGYKPPLRFLPYKTRSVLRNREMTSLRRLARTMPPHFALGKNRQHQGLATAMVKLWEKSAIAKIAIKRGIPNTCNERMAEEIKKLTGGILLSRNKEYIVFCRGNDFLTPSIRDVLVEKQKLANIQQDEEEVARLRASTSIILNARTAKGPLVAGTLAETMEAKTRWGNPLTAVDREKMKRDLALAKHASTVRHLQRKLASAKAKVRNAEKALANVQEFLKPAGLPIDLETVTDEERFLFRKIGLKMKPFLHLGKRGVFDGTVENMHFHWKYRELVKIFVKGKSFAQVKHIAISLEAESGGVLISLDKTTKGYAIILYRGKNYQRPQTLRPKNLLTRRQALARSIELQRREALNHHIANLQNKIQMLKSQLHQMVAKKWGNEDLDLQVDDALLSDDDVEEEGEEAYLETYDSGDDDDDAATGVS